MWHIQPYFRVIGSRQCLSEMSDFVQKYTLIISSLSCNLSVNICSLRQAETIKDQFIVQLC